jgi:hypothetical protein
MSIHRWISDEGWHTWCSECPWTECRKTRALRDQAADGHEISHLNERDICAQIESQRPGDWQPQPPTGGTPDLNMTVRAFR